LKPFHLLRDLLDCLCRLSGVSTEIDANLFTFGFESLLGLYWALLVLAVYFLVVYDASDAPEQLVVDVCSVYEEGF